MLGTGETTTLSFSHSYQTRFRGVPQCARAVVTFRFPSISRNPAEGVGVTFFCASSLGNGVFESSKSQRRMLDPS